jgi:hypothetical protein
MDFFGVSAILCSTSSIFSAVLFAGRPLPFLRRTLPIFKSIFIAESGDSKLKKFLFERISFAIQRGNAASIWGTFPDSPILSEIFVLIKQKCYVIS